MSKKVEAVPQSDEKYVEALRNDFPDIEVSRLEHLGSGWDSVAMLINEELVFRFPRELFEKGGKVKTEITEREIKILRWLGKKNLAFEIPNPGYVAPGNKYFGYRLLPGILWSEAPDQPSSTDEFLRSWVSTREGLAEAIKPSDAPRLGIKSYGGDKNIVLSKKYLKDPRAGKEEKRLVNEAIKIVETKLPDQDTWRFIHQDLQPKNCLLDPRSYLINGVLDFGDAEIGPVEADYAFWGKWHDNTLQRLADIQADLGYDLDLQLVTSLQLLYFASDFMELHERGFSESAEGKAEHLRWYVENWGEL